MPIFIWIDVTYIWLSLGCRKIGGGIFSAKFFVWRTKETSFNNYDKNFHARYSVFCVTTSFLLNCAFFVFGSPSSNLICGCVPSANDLLFGIKLFTPDLCLPHNIYSLCTLYMVPGSRPKTPRLSFKEIEKINSYLLAWQTAKFGELAKQWRK